MFFCRHIHNFIQNSIVILQPSQDTPPQKKTNIAPSFLQDTDPKEAVNGEFEVYTRKTWMNYIDY